MLTKIHKKYIKNKLKISIKIKKLLKNTILLSIIKNNNIANKIKLVYLLKFQLKNKNKTSINDLCLNSSLYKKSNKNTNFSRYEFHKLCRSNKNVS